MPYKLISATGGPGFELRDGAPMVIGRATGNDIPVFDATISRRHAELVVDGDALAVRDLGSSNGTFVNGARVTVGRAMPGDTVAFGNVKFQVQLADTPPRTSPLRGTGTETLPGGSQTIVRSLHDPGGKLSQVMRAADLGEIRGAPADSDHERTEKKLALLLEVSKGLSRAVDVDLLLDRIVGFVFQILDVDRAAIMLVDESGTLVPKISRDRAGVTAARAVPQSIARTVLADKVAILSDNAPEDNRFTGESIVMQSVRSAICAPLVGSEERVQGVLYVDNLTTTHRFGDEDLEFLLAFSTIAAVAIENSRFAERLRRQALVRSNFERYFAPALAARIAESADTIRLGGEKRQVVVLFSDIRGFTAISEQMRPDDVALLLSEYLTVMVECVFRHGGTLDKFIGDAVMAQWGAPLGRDDDADRAVQAAVEMMRELETLNAKWLGEGRPAMQIGIGLNAGEVFAGNIGSERRLEFTVIGDAVNVASRLCAAAGPGEILVTDALRERLAGAPALERRSPMELKGKSQPLPVYRVQQ